MEKSKRLSPNITISDCPSQVFCTKFSPDDKYLAAGCGDGAIRVFHARNGALAYTLQNPNPSGMPFTAIRFRPLMNATKNVLLAVSTSLFINADGSIQHWHITSGKCLHTISNEKNQLYALDYRLDGTQFAVAGRDYAVHVYDEKTRKEIAVMKGGTGTRTAGHSNRVFSLKYHPKMEHVIISGGWDDTIQIWDVRIGLSVRGIYGPHLAGDAVDVNDQNEILTGSWRPENPLELWDFASGKQLCSIPWHQSNSKGEACFVYAAQFSKGTTEQLIAAGGSGSNETKLFYRDNTKLLGTITGQTHGVFTLDFSSAGDQLAVGGADAAIRIIDIFDPVKMN
ncbi:unnamed protein product [Albugo candida]|uniref:Uncharacterized protein n=1 Tax=Albugo candida TaxID=65357 RepID=A0A024GK81_9STRA|nr:unnamed protein product [Albugo candida]|eukprot:CCI47183.1 unnamed protein product [Albugo candida]